LALEISDGLEGDTLYSVLGLTLQPTSMLRGVVYLPSTVGPAGLTAAGLPVGYQAIAASGRDKTATAFSRLVEKEICGFVPPPGYD
jgi:Asp-tRNA(Asn)/Glu-tRNA(Gln) amidotransferase A subunit family amidase